MGTTRDAIRGQSGVELCYVLCIEGYKYLLSDYHDMTAVETAWAATTWNDCLPGLQVSGDMSQSLRPWSNEPSVPSMTFTVMGDNSADQFATDVFKNKPTNRSELTVGFDTATSGLGSFNITVQKASGFAANTPVYIGGEAFNVTGTPTGTTISVAANGGGYWAPFYTNVGAANTFPKPHNLPPNNNINTFDSNSPVWVDDSPTNWVGKTVGLFVHRVVNGVLDTKAEAEVWFAGKISDVSETDYGTQLDCVGIQQSIIDAEVLADQWTGRLAEGYVFDGTEEFFGIFNNLTTANTGPAISAAFTTTGRLTVDEFCSEFAAFLDADTTVGINSSLALRWSAGVRPTSQGMRVIITASQPTATANKFAYVQIHCRSIPAITFLGWDVTGTDADDGSSTATGPRSSGDEWSLTAPSAPFRYPTIGVKISPKVMSIEIESSDGTFFDQTTLLPHEVQQLVSGDSWGLFSVGDSTLFIGRYVSATSITGVTWDIGLPGISLQIDKAMQGLRVGDGKSLRVKQCLFLTGTFTSIIAKLFASIDGNGANHATYDVFPFGASIPWSLLGQNFLDSLGKVEQSHSEDSISIIVEKPMKLWDIIKSDFALRFAAPIWKDGGIQIAQLTTPNASTADYALDHTNFGDERKTVPRTTSDYLCHTLKIEYNRTIPDDKYLDTYIVRDQAAYEQSGKSGTTKTIKARNSYGGVIATGSSVEALADMISSRFMPVFARPLKTWTRSIPHTLFHMCPGDTVTVTDDRVRNPNTGARGISARPAVVVSVSHSLGISSGGQGYHGEVELLYSEEDRLFPVAPSAEHASITSGSFTSGWNAGGVTLLIHEHKFSDSTDSTDGSHFTSGTIVRITEADPADPASADSFLDELDGDAGTINLGGTDYDTFSLINGFGSGGRPAFDSAKTYIVNYAEYDLVTSAQKLYAYQADNADGEILDTIDANICGDELQSTGSATADLTLLPSRHADEQFGDGVPLSASFIRDQIRNANNLQNYRCATAAPWMDDSTGITVGSGATMFHVRTTAFLIEGGLWLGGRKRLLNVAPMYSSTSGSSATVSITLSQAPPVISLNGSGFALAEFIGPTSTASWTTTSTTDFTLGATAQLLPIRAMMDTSLTFITVEINGNATLKGLAECWLGPLQ